MLLVHQFPRHEIIPAVLREMAETSENVLIAAKQPAKLLLLIDLIQALPGSTLTWQERVRAAAVKLQEENKDPLRAVVDELIAKATHFLSLTADGLAIWEKMHLRESMALLSHSKERLEQVKTWLEDAVRIAAPVSYKLAEIQSLQAKAAEKLARVETQITSGEQALTQERLTVLAEVQQCWQDVQVAEQFVLQMPKWFSEQTRREVEASKAAAVHLTLAAAYGFQLRFGEDPLVSQIFQDACQILDRRGTVDWQELVKFAEGKLGGIRRELDQARDFFVQGKLDAAAAEADRLAQNYGASPELIELHKEITRTATFHAWQQEHLAELQAGEFQPALLKGIEAHLNSRLPIVYWQGCPAQHYLVELYKKTTAELRTAKPGSARVAALTAIISQMKSLQKNLPKQ
jgi:hypothetical protein